MEPFYEPFLASVPAGGDILDVGCGSGRDTLAFQRGGYRVTAIDPSAGMAPVASERISQPVALLQAQDVTAEYQFDGIWACASLLHVPRAEMEAVFARLTRALRPDGVWHMSFKLGEAEEVSDARLFNDYTEASLRRAIEAQPLLTILRVWLTEDRSLAQKEQTWVNALVRQSQNVHA
jgi:2-polyprenyl-3-methyl-5-hydroxy-6-metoxy-1,4-benzoquinol methylase